MLLTAYCLLYTVFMTYIRPKKSLGQNFLKDPHYLRKIVDAAGVTDRDQVIEIGPGLGHLTAALAERAQKVLALELDERLISPLKEQFRDNEKIEIVQADALEYPYQSLSGKWKVVANLPYYISTPVIQRLLACRDIFSSLTLMLQKEVAGRIAALPGGREYGFLSVLVQLYAKVRIEFAVPAAAFTPRPEVDSAVITLRMKPLAETIERDFLIKVLKAAFSQRRKTLKNALKQLDIPGRTMDMALDRTGIDLARRAETLSVQEFVALADFLKSSP